MTRTQPLLHTPGLLLALLAVLVVGASSHAAGAAAAAPQQQELPPQLVAQLEGEIARANRSLEKERRRVARSAKAQQQATAEQARIKARAELVTEVASLGPMRLPARTARTLKDAAAAAKQQATERDRALERHTQQAAQAQARAADADRRLRALRRASATADERDTTLGSWRFGSGGPAVSAESLDQYLASKGSPLAGQGAAFLESGVEHEVDPRLVVAIAGAESYFGIITCAPHNAWGWGCPTSPFRFDSWAEAIDTVTLGLRENYLDGGRTSVGEIHLKYAPPNADNDPTGLNYAWPNNVAKFLVEQGGDPQAVGGVLGPSR